MTRRILAGFLSVLTAVIAAIVVPLGLRVTAQQRDDFRDGTSATARAVAAVAEEQLDDHHPAALSAALTRLAAPGDRIAVFDAAGRVVGGTGSPPPPHLVTAARRGRPLPGLDGAVVVSVPVGAPTARLGLVLLARDTGVLAHRQNTLWAWLTAAAAAALIVGGAVGWALSRWIARPLAGLAGAADRIGTGDTSARAPAAGPPQVRQVTDAFNGMADRVASLLDIQRGMTAEVSHQLRTPLAALRLRLELLAADLDTRRADDVLAMIEETNRLSRLVDGLLALARAEATQPMPQPIDLTPVATERLSAWQPVADEHNVALRLHAVPVIAAATPGHVEQILDNLLDNALGVVPDGGQVTVTLSTDGVDAVLTVADNGPGMSAEQRTHALDRYYTDRASDGGAGLGLHVVARLATVDHGTTALRETPGGGLTVEMHLPLAEPAKTRRAPAEHTGA